MRHALRFRVLAPLALCLSSSALMAAAPAAVRSFDAVTVGPAEVIREVRSSPANALFQLKGLRGPDGEALTLALEPARIFADDFHLYVDGVDRGGDAAARLSLLRGTVEEWPGSSVALTLNAATGAWNGLLVDGGQVYEIELPAGLANGTVAESAVVRRTEPEAIAKSPFTDALEAPGGLAKVLGGTKIVTAPGGEFDATLAIDSDYELFQIFGNVEEATDYIAGVLSDVSELYFRQVGVALTITSFSLYTTPNDPWNAPNPHTRNGEVLCEFGSYWQKLRPVKKFPRNGALFFTGKDSQDIGGQAWISSLCNYKAKPSSCPFGAYGIVVLSKRRPFDPYIVAHELGHIFGSRHTHCYNPPIDHCLGTEQGCYSGLETRPEDGGSVMSYCNPFRLSLGEPGRYGVQSERVVDVIRGFVDSVAGSCLQRTNDPYRLAGEGGPGSATITWIDPFTTEANWLVEQRLPNGKFKPLKSLPADTTTVTLTALKRGANGFRVRAKFKKDFSDYSSAVTVQVE